MTNAKTELLHILQGHGTRIKCAVIALGDEYSDTTQQVFNLKLGASDKEVDDFFNSLDFEYDSGYGRQELFGTVWLEKEGTWLTRGEYDGSEWWEFHECPEIPMEML
jgi:hypothetical protein